MNRQVSATADSIATTRQALRAQMPIAGKYAYMDHAAVAPISQRAIDAMAAWLAEAGSEGDVVWPRWASGVEATRAAAARLIGADVDEIALVPNTTAGINFVAEGLDWRSGDNVVTLADEFPSNLYPWMHLADRGVETRRIPTADGRVDYDQLANTCDARTRVIAVSWVAFSNGCRRNLDNLSQIARDKGVLLSVDAIQGLGVFPIDVRKTPIDFLQADGHKWMLGPEGAGLAYVRRDRLPQLRATGVGWHSVTQGSNYTKIELNLKPTAGRYEGGTQNMAGMLGFGASLELLLSLGTENVAAAVLDITDTACAELNKIGARVWSPRDGDERSGIVSFELPGLDPATARAKCLERGVVLISRGGRIRISPHAYTDEADVARLIEALLASKS